MGHKQTDIYRFSYKIKKKNQASEDKKTSATLKSKILKILGKGIPDIETLSNNKMLTCRLQAEPGRIHPSVTRPLAEVANTFPFAGDIIHISSVLMFSLFFWCVCV